VYGNVLTVGDDAGAQEQQAPGAPAVPAEAPVADGQWRLWEVFTQEAQGAPHEHAGSVRATTAEHALQNARDVYSRRGKVLSMWVVPTEAIAASTPDDVEPFFDPGNDKPYRHPHFYKTPRGVRGL
jgi:ring-1,2-phenylacetyl-CoA epoxidase subunit PaaB